MTLDEVIKHCEKIVDVNVRQYKNCPMIYNVDGYEHQTASECAKEYWQIAEWLKELKTHREIHDVLLQLLVDFEIDVCCDDLFENEKEHKICEETCDFQTKGCWVRWAKMKVRDKDADSN
jgi:hypothetical protein